jgi:hypothetical protein
MVEAGTAGSSTPIIAAVLAVTGDEDALPGNALPAALATTIQRTGLTGFVVTTCTVTAGNILLAQPLHTGKSYRAGPTASATTVGTTLLASTGRERALAAQATLAAPGAPAVRRTQQTVLSKACFTYPVSTAVAAVSRTGSATLVRRADGIPAIRTGLACPVKTREPDVTHTAGSRATVGAALPARTCSECTGPFHALLAASAPAVHRARQTALSQQIIAHPVAAAIPAVRRTGHAVFVFIAHPVSTCGDGNTQTLLTHEALVATAARSPAAVVPAHLPVTAKEHALVLNTLLLASAGTVLCAGSAVLCVQRLADLVSAALAAVRRTGEAGFIGIADAIAALRNTIGIRLGSDADPIRTTVVERTGIQVVTHSTVVSREVLTFPLHAPVDGAGVVIAAASLIQGLAFTGSLGVAPGSGAGIVILAFLVQATRSRYIPPVELISGLQLIWNVDDGQIRVRLRESQVAGVPMGSLSGLAILAGVRTPS